MTELPGEGNVEKVVVNHRNPMKGRCKDYSCESTDIGEEGNKGVNAENRVPMREEDKEEKSQIQKHLTREVSIKNKAL